MSLQSLHTRPSGTASLGAPHCCYCGPHLCRLRNLHLIIAPGPEIPSHSTPALWRLMQKPICYCVHKQCVWSGSSSQWLKWSYLLSRVPLILVVRYLWNQMNNRRLLASIAWEQRKIYLGHSEACGIIPTPRPRILPWGPQVCLPDSALTINSSRAGTMSICLYIPQFLVLEHDGHSVNFCWTKVLDSTLLQKVINLVFIVRINLGQGGKFFLDQSKVSSPETQVILLTLHFF